MIHIEKPYSCELCQISYYTSSELSRHEKFPIHLKKLESTENTVPPSTSTSFVDFGEADVKPEIKEEETLDEETIDKDPLSSSIEAENIKETLKQEITEEETLDEVPLSINKEDEINEDSLKQEIEEEIQFLDPLSCEQNSDEDLINTVDIVEHKITPETNLKPFKCEICNMTFSHIDSFTSHVDIHSLPRTYTCDLCEETFLQKIKLEEHKTECQKQKCENMYSCHMCERTFPFKHHLESHKSFHLKKLETPNKAVSPSLSSNCIKADINHEEKPFFCNRCKVTFRTIDKLIGHISKKSCFEVT